jgi:microcystin-dependent protein
MGLAPSGSIVMWSAATAPAGWLLCQGQSVPIAQYPALFSVISTTYGAGSSPGSTFNLPNLSGRFPLGDDTGGTYALTGTGGSATHTNTLGEMVAHTHTMGNHTHPGVNHIHDLQNHTHGVPGVDHLHGLGGHTHSYISVAGGTGIASGSGWAVVAATSGAPSATTTVFADRSLATTTAGPLPSTTGNADRDLTTGVPSTNTTSSAGSGTAYSILPPYLVLNFVIKT